jgi:hypothetical protein
MSEGKVMDTGEGHISSSLSFMRAMLVLCGVALCYRA